MAIRREALNLFQGGKVLASSELMRLDEKSFRDPCWTNPAQALSAESLAYLEHAGKTNADWTAVDNLVRLQFAHAQSFPHDLLALIRDRMAAGHGGFPPVGTPRQVADGIISLAESVFRGTTLSFVDYVAEFPYFRDSVLPLLAGIGLRD